MDLDKKTGQEIKSWAETQNSGPSPVDFRAIIIYG
jgi:hypothetical protein